MNLNKKTIIVTGGLGLIGAEIVKFLKKRNINVINADLNLSTDLGKGLLNMDITNESSILEGFELVYKKFKKIDGLVNNAYPRTKDWGIKFSDLSMKSWRDNIDLQLNSYFLCMQTAVKYMKLSGSGSIVNIASIYGVVGPDFSIYKGTNMTSAPQYAAIKGGLINFSKYLASHLGKLNIRVNCVSPGGVLDNQSKVFLDNYNSKVPMGRLAYASEIAPPVAFLLSEDSSYITGHNLLVDGGWTAI